MVIITVQDGETMEETSQVRVQGYQLYIALSLYGLFDTFGCLHLGLQSVIIFIPQ